MKTKTTVINLKLEAQKPGGPLEGFVPSRWVPTGHQVAALIEAVGGEYDPNDLFVGGSLDDQWLFHPETGQYALLSGHFVAVASCYE